MDEGLVSDSPSYGPRGIGCPWHAREPWLTNGVVVVPKGYPAGGWPVRCREQAARTREAARSPDLQPKLLHLSHVSQGEEPWELSRSPRCLTDSEATPRAVGAWR